MWLRNYNLLGKHRTSGLVVVVVAVTGLCEWVHHLYIGVKTLGVWALSPVGIYSPLPPRLPLQQQQPLSRQRPGMQLAKAPEWG